MPFPAVRCRPEQTIVKMVTAPDLSLRGRFAPVAISGRHLQSVQGVDKTHGPIASVAALSERHGQLQIWRHSRRMCNASKFVIARPRRGRGNLGKAVSFSPMAFLRSGYDLRDCTPRALPRASRSGRHVGLRPPRNDKLGGLAPLNCCCTTCNCLRRSGSAAAAEPSKYPGMHPRKCGKAVAVGGFTKRSKKTSVWVLTKLRLGGIVSLALRGTEC